MDQQVHNRLNASGTDTLYTAASKAKRIDRPASISCHGLYETGNIADLLARHRIAWNHTKDCILIITKSGDNDLVLYTRRLVEWLATVDRFGKECPLTVYVDAHLKTSRLFNYDSLVQEDAIFDRMVKFWTPRLCRNDPRRFHLILTLGGDGTVLLASWLFQSFVPPILPFHLGSLGFLTPFSFASSRQTLQGFLEGHSFQCAMRMRLACTVYRYRKDLSAHQEARQSSRTGKLWTRRNDSVEPWELHETVWLRKQLKQEIDRLCSDTDRKELHEQIPCYTTMPTEEYHVLNELVVDRGPSASMSVLELFGDERHLTTVQADGLCISTPTGSTAYSLSALGSLMHPDVRAILVTPVCPHTLNFRPMILPETMTIRIAVPFSSRKSAYCSFDGRGQVELKQGDHVKIVMSPHPVPSVCKTDYSNDWFDSLQSCLQWNQRRRQKPFVVVESNETNAQTDQQNDRRSPSPERTCKNIFACIDSRCNATPDSQEKEQDHENDQNASVELPSWTPEELLGEDCKKET